MYANEVQGCLMQARFIEIHQVFANKNKVGYFSNRPRTIHLYSTQFACKLFTEAKTFFIDVEVFNFGKNKYY